MGSRSRSRDLERVPGKGGPDCVLCALQPSLRDCSDRVTVTQDFVLDFVLG